MEILKYQGNDKYIIGLTRNDQQKYIFFAKIDSILLNDEKEELDSYDNLIKHILSRKYTIEFLLELSNDNSFIHLLEIEDEKEYDIVCKILEIML